MALLIKRKGNYNNKGPATHRLHYARVGGELGGYIYQRKLDPKKIRPFKKLAVCPAKIVCKYS
jgi:hypothetical protein